MLDSVSHVSAVDAIEIMLSAATDRKVKRELNDTVYPQSHLEHHKMEETEGYYPLRRSGSQMVSVHSRKDSVNARHEDSAGSWMGSSWKGDGEIVGSWPLGQTYGSSLNRDTFSKSLSSVNVRSMIKKKPSAGATNDRDVFYGSSVP